MTSNEQVITYLLNLSATKTTSLTIKEVRNYLQLPDTVGTRTLNLFFPSLKFTNCNYKGVSYITIKKR